MRIPIYKPNLHLNSAVITRKQINFVHS